MAIENDDTNKSELESTVDQAVKSVLGDRVEPNVGEQPPQEAIESVDPPELESATEGAAAAESAKPWFSDADKELAQSYGFGDDDLKDFADAKEFNRVTRLLDRQLLNSIPKAEAAPAEPQKQNGQAQPPAPTGEPAKSKFSKIDLAKLKESGYDEETLSHLANQNALVEHLEQLEQQRAQEKEQLKTLENGFTQFQQMMWQADNQRRINAFHASVDRLDPERFGKVFSDDGKVAPLAADKDALRQKLFDTVEDFKDRLTARGQQLPPEEVLLRRAKNFLFADDIAKAERAKVHQEIAEQSKKRRPVQQARTAAGTFAKPIGQLPQHERISRVAADPDLQALHQSFQEANGAPA